MGSPLRHNAGNLPCTQATGQGGGGRTGLTSITIPNSETSIGNTIFYECESLESIEVDEANTIYDSRDNCNAIIKTATNELIAGCKNTTIPSSVTSIGYLAFYGCTSLKSITIPSSVTKISQQAFDACKDLEKVYFKHTTPPTFQSSCFKKQSGGVRTTYYFKKSTVANAFNTNYYDTSYGVKSTDYSW